MPFLLVPYLAPDAVSACLSLGNRCHVCLPLTWHQMPFLLAPHLASPCIPACPSLGTRCHVCLPLTWHHHAFLTVSRCLWAVLAHATDVPAAVSACQLLIISRSGPSHHYFGCLSLCPPLFVVRFGSSHHYFGFLSLCPPLFVWRSGSSLCCSNFCEGMEGG